MRSFAKQLKLPPGTLSRILSSKRGISPKLAYQILKKLKTPEPQMSILVKGLIQDPLGFEEVYQYIPGIMLTSRQIALMNRWEFSAIRVLLRTKSKFKNNREIAKKLGISTLVARDCLEIMKNQKLIDFDGTHWICLGPPTQTPIHPNPDVRKILEEFIQLSLRTIGTSKEDHTNLSGITIVADINRYQSISRGGRAN